MLMEFVFVLFSLLTGEDDTMSCSLFFYRFARAENASHAVGRRFTGIFDRVIVTGRKQDLP